MTPTKDTVRLAALADLHFTRHSVGTLQPLFAQAAAAADVLLLLGDLTDTGTADEANLLARELAGVKVPMIGVLGNHDFESGKQDEVREILVRAGVRVLDGESYEINGVGFAGVKGFGGGFDRRLLEPWGEPAVKEFVREAVSEAVKLDSALSRLRTAQRVALLHYAPVRATVENEPLEILPFLGSSRLEEPLNRHKPAVVLHGHAHRGTFEGKTHAGVPVYNVALPLLRHTFPDRPPFFALSLPAAGGAPEKR